jgi:hypothetical protein
MANKFKILRSNVAGARPTGRETGEIFLNMADRVIGFIDPAGKAVDLGGSGASPIKSLGSVATEADMLALSTAKIGDFCTRTDRSTNWILVAADPTKLTSWIEWTYPKAEVKLVVTPRTGSPVDVALSPFGLPIGKRDGTSVDVQLHM